MSTPLRKILATPLSCSWQRPHKAAQRVYTRVNKINAAGGVSSPANRAGHGEYAAAPALVERARAHVVKCSSMPSCPARGTCALDLQDTWLVSQARTARQAVVRPGRRHFFHLDDRRNGYHRRGSAIHGRAAGVAAAPPRGYEHVNWRT